MLMGIKRWAIKLCLTFVLLLCISSWFTISASAYTNETVDSEKAAEFNSAISEVKQQSTIINSSEGVKGLAKVSAYSLNSVTSGTSDENLIINGNFESDPNNNGTWKVFYDNTKQIPEFSWDDQTYYGTSGRSLSIKGDNVNGSIVNKVAIKPGNTYSFSAFGKGLDIAASGEASIFIGQYDKNDNLIPGTDNFFTMDGTFDWQTAKAKFVADPNACGVLINLMLDGSGTAWFDDISLINTGVIPVPESKVVANTGIKKSTYKGFKVNLDGSKSFAKDGSSLTYNWSFESQPSGSTSTLSGADTANPYFIPDVAGDYNLSLTVQDNNGNSDTKKVTIKAKEFNDISDDDSSSINKLTQKILEGYYFCDFIPLSNGWVIVGETSKKQIIILNTLTGEVGKSYQLEESPYKIDFDFDKGIIFATQSTTNKIAKIDVNSGNVSYITTTANTENGGISDIEIGKDNIVFYLCIDYPNSVVGILDISQNTEIGHMHLQSAGLMSFNQVNNELILGDSGLSPSSLLRYKYDEQNHSLIVLQNKLDLGSNGEDLTISNDGKHMAFCCGGGNGDGYTIFDIDSKDIYNKFGEWDIGAYPVSAVFSCDNKYLLATNNSEVKLFSVDNHTLIKTVGPNIWQGLARVGISRGNKIGYAYTNEGELYIFRMDDSSSLPLNIESISTDKESPQLESTDISVTANTSDGANDNFYHFIVYDGDNWALQQAYSTSNTFNWKPEAAGEYYLVVEAKDVDSVNDYDVYNTIRYNITKAPASITISGPSNCTITSGKSTTLDYSASVEDNEGNVIPEQDVSWSIDGQVEGVQIDGNTGVVTVDSTAHAGSFTIKATTGSILATFVVTITATLPDERIISGRISLKDKAPAGGVNVHIEADGFTLGHCYGMSITINEGESSKDFAIPVSVSSAGLIYKIHCTARAGDAIGFTDDGGQVDVSNGNVSNVNMQIDSFLQPVYRNVSGTVSFKKGVAPKGGFTLIIESSTTINTRITKECYSSVTIPEGMNSANYTIPIITYAGYPCSLRFKDTSRYYWGSQLDLSTGDITGLDADITYALNTTETRNLSGTIYLSTGVAPKGGINITWYSSSGLYTNASSVTIPEGLNSIKYDATFVTDTSEQTVLRFEPDKLYKQYSFIVGNTDLVKDITLEKIGLPLSAPKLTGFTWTPGDTVGTTKATAVPAGTLKYTVGAAGSQVQPNVGDATNAYKNSLSANTDIAVTAGQHIYIVKIGIDGTITDWADIIVDSANIKAAEVAPPAGGGILPSGGGVLPPAGGVLPPVGAGLPILPTTLPQTKPEPKDGELSVVPVVNKDIATVELSSDEYKSLQDSGTAKDGIKNLRLSIDNAATPIVNIKVPIIVLSNSAKEVTTSLNTSIADIEVPSNMLYGTSIKGSGDIEFNVSKVDLNTLPTKVAEMIGNASVIDISLTRNGTLVPWSNLNAPVKISIPYTLKNGENGDDLTVYFIGSSGKLENMQGVYNTVTKAVTFYTTHFSKYFVKANKVSYTDLKGFESYKKYIENMASKGIIEGVSANKYSPEKILTRAEFATLLVKMLKLDTTNTNNIFVDVKATDWYAPYVNAAYKAGLINGIGSSKFAPNEVITNQDAAVILLKALKYKNAKINENTLSNVKDMKIISKYASDSVAFVLNNDIMSLDNNGNFNARNTVNRAAAAKYIYYVFYYVN